jgi:hypothetical protein
LKSINLQVGHANTINKQTSYTQFNSAYSNPRSVAFCEFVEFKSIYTEVKDSLNLVFDFTCYETNYYPTDIECTEGFSDYRILENGNEFFDIETKSEEFEWEDKTWIFRSKLTPRIRDIN